MGSPSSARAAGCTAWRSRRRRPGPPDRSSARRRATAASGRRCSRTVLRVAQDAGDRRSGSSTKRHAALGAGWRGSWRGSAAASGELEAGGQARPGLVQPQRCPRQILGAGPSAPPPRPAAAPPGRSRQVEQHRPARRRARGASGRDGFKAEGDRRAHRTEMARCAVAGFNCSGTSSDRPKAGGCFSMRIVGADRAWGLVAVLVAAGRRGAWCGPSTFQGPAAADAGAGSRSAAPVTVDVAQAPPSGCQPGDRRSPTIRHQDRAEDSGRRVDPAARPAAAHLSLRPRAMTREDLASRTLVYTWAGTDPDPGPHRADGPPGRGAGHAGDREGLEASAVRRRHRRRTRSGAAGPSTTRAR